jgi:hypothetical protein
MLSSKAKQQQPAAMAPHLAVKLTLLFFSLNRFAVGAFQSSPYHPKLAIINVAVWKHYTKPSVHGRTTANIILAAKRDNGNIDENNQKDTSSLWDIIKEKPGTLIAAPFVVLVGLDLVANIFFMTKRTVEYFAFGKLPSTEVWFSDNLFL